MVRRKTQEIELSNWKKLTFAQVEERFFGLHAMQNFANEKISDVK